MQRLSGLFGSDILKGDLLKRGPFKRDPLKGVLFKRDPLKGILCKGSFINIGP